MTVRLVTSLIRRHGLWYVFLRYTGASAKVTIEYMRTYVNKKENKEKNTRRLGGAKRKDTWKRRKRRAMAPPSHCDKNKWSPRRVEKKKSTKRSKPFVELKRNMYEGTSVQF